jgi:sucrose-6-phosphate hydrolase SacC (GH32 family)
VIVYEVKKQELVVNDHRAPAPLRNGRQRLTLFCDRTGLEIFASSGRSYIPMPFLPKPENPSLSLEAKGGRATLNSLQVHELKSAWAP